MAATDDKKKHSAAALEDMAANLRATISMKSHSGIHSGLESLSDLDLEVREATVLGVIGAHSVPLLQPKNGCANFLPLMLEETVAAREVRSIRRALGAERELLAFADEALTRRPADPANERMRSIFLERVENLSARLADLDSTLLRCGVNLDKLAPEAVAAYLIALGVCDTDRLRLFPNGSANLSDRLLQMERFRIYCAKFWRELRDSGLLPAPVEKLLVWAAECDKHGWKPNRDFVPTSVEEARLLYNSQQTRKANRVRTWVGYIKASKPDPAAKGTLELRPLRAWLYDNEKKQRRRKSGSLQILAIGSRT
jgi:hypothetical protein